MAEQVRLANNFFLRLRGLLFTKSLPSGKGLLISPCKSIHSIGMSYAIDAVFLDSTNNVVGVISDFKPGQISAIYWKAVNCLELPAGTIAQSSTVIGDKIDFIS